MPEVKKDQSAGKRQQIYKSGRTMFAWVAGASVIAGFAVVVAGFLIQRIVFESKVVVEKQNTVNTLQANNKAVDKLRDEIRVLNTNAALSSVKLNDNEEPLRVILDALPADNNALALGASVQSLVARTSDVKLESFQVGEDVATSDDTAKLGSSVKGVQQIPFTMSISAANPDALRDVLKNLEKSIRVIDIDAMTIEQGDSRVVMTVNGHGYYLPAKTIQLTKKEVKP
ncbi:hypothetical protein EUA66_00995 [TM7 phylum sp. oral taxon 349]|jgi:hypothetical protein cdiviTM7_02679|nr:hypothetical protein J5A52_04880 [TM7 phylum sp. oral taxon 349]RKV96852.1 MAG: hypothetical protein D8G53_05990 [Candidatus Saccharimonas sp.]TWP24201.1 hypothetical protein EUA66_00995 [TM7 phylum sp. oral taxon 349]